MSVKADRERYLRGLAVESLAKFDGSLDELARVTGDVDSILRSLDGIADADFLISAIRQWGQLEILFSLALDEGRSELTDDECVDAREIAKELEACFRQYP